MAELIADEDMLLPAELEDIMAELLPAVDVSVAAALLDDELLDDELELEDPPALEDELQPATAKDRAATAATPMMVRLITWDLLRE